MSQSVNLYNQLANHNLFKKSVNFGLKRIKLALDLLGNPEKSLKNVISVIGESGKFTTLNSLKSFIEANNQTVTAHISPSIRDIKERFYMNKKNLSYKNIKKTIKQIEKLNWLLLYNSFRQYRMQYSLSNIYLNNDLFKTLIILICWKIYKNTKN